MKRRLRLSYLAITICLLVVQAVPLAITYDRSQYTELGRDASVSVHAIAGLATEPLARGDTAALADIAEFHHTRTGGAIAIFHPDGGLAASANVPHDPRPPEARLGAHPDVVAALARGQASTTPPPAYERHPGWLSVAEPIVVDGEVIGAVDLAVPTDGVEANITRLWLWLAVLSLLALTVAWVVGARVAAWVSVPLDRLRASAASWSRGELGARAEVERGPEELRVVGRTFDDMADRLEQVIAAQRGFVADASHQLRQPLTIFRMRLANLRPELRPAGWARLEELDASVAGFAQRLDDLLLLATTNQQEQLLRQVDAAAVALDRSDVWKPEARRRRVTLELHVTGPDHPWVWELPGALEQIVDNYLANALDAAPPGSTISLDVVATAGAVELHVVDQGVGMSEVDRAAAFERFWRGGGGAVDGNGLGLAIVRRLAAGMGAEVRLAEAPSGGVDAVVMLRPAPPPSPERPGPPQRQSELSDR